MMHRGHTRGRIPRGQSYSWFIGRCASGRGRSVWRLGSADQALVRQHHPAAALALDALDASRAGKNIARPDRVLAVASLDQSDIVANSEHDIPAQQGSRPFDRTGRLHGDIRAELGWKRGWLR